MILVPVTLFFKNYLSVLDFSGAAKVHNQTMPTRKLLSIEPRYRCREIKSYTTAKLKEAKRRNRAVVLALLGGVVVAIWASHASAQSSSLAPLSSGVHITYSPPPGAPSVAQREKARELLPMVRAALDNVLAAPPESRCAALKRNFVVERMSQYCKALQGESLILQEVSISAGSQDDESASPALYVFQFRYGHMAKSQKSTQVATVFVRAPDLQLRIETPLNVPTLSVISHQTP